MKKTTLDKKLQKKEEKLNQQKNNKELFDIMYDECKNWEDFEMGATTKYIKFMIKEWKMFAEVTISGKQLKVILLNVRKDVDNQWKEYEKGMLVRKVPDDFGWVLNTEFKISNEEQLKEFMKYLEMSYSIRFKEKHEKLAKEERLKELSRRNIVEPQIFNNGRKSLGQLKLETRKARNLYRKGKITKAEANEIIQPYIDRLYELCMKRYKEFKDICKTEGLNLKIEKPVKLKINDLLK